MFHVEERAMMCAVIFYVNLVVNQGCLLAAVQQVVNAARWYEEGKILEKGGQSYGPEAEDKCSSKDCARWNARYWDSNVGKKVC